MFESDPVMNSKCGSKEIFLCSVKEGLGSQQCLTVVNGAWCFVSHLSAHLKCTVNQKKMSTKLNYKLPKEKVCQLPSCKMSKRMGCCPPPPGHLRSEKIQYSGILFNVVDYQANFLSQGVDFPSF